ncbi:MAG: SsrA-binding protein, partial [Sphingobacteriia bacterium]|nr:SsrA-binding protein [Sphingobacteriia bacterium]
FAKVEIALARGRKSHDKRQALKEKDLDRDQLRDL